MRNDKLGALLRHFSPRRTADIFACGAIALLPGACRQKSQASIDPRASLVSATHEYLSFDKFAGAPAAGAGAVLGRRAGNTILLAGEDGTKILTLTREATILDEALPRVAAPLPGTREFRLDQRTRWVIQAGALLLRSRNDTSGVSADRKIDLGEHAPALDGARVVGFGQDWIAFRPAQGGLVCARAGDSQDEVVGIRSETLPADALGAELLRSPDGKEWNLLVPTRVALVSLSGTPGAQQSWKRSVAGWNLPFAAGDTLSAILVWKESGSLPEQSGDALTRGAQPMALVVEHAGALAYAMLTGEKSDLFRSPGKVEAANVAWNDIAPIAKSYCVACHAGASAFKASSEEIWNARGPKLKQHLADRTMPPPGAMQPTEKDRATLDAWMGAGK